MKERAHLSEVVEIFDETQRIASSIHETEALVEDEQDDELKELAEQELHQLRGRSLALEEKLKSLLMPRDPSPLKRSHGDSAGTGGEEAALFAAGLYRRYTRYADGGLESRSDEHERDRARRRKEIIFSISGEPPMRGFATNPESTGCSACRPPRLRQDPHERGHGRRAPEMEETEIEIRPRTCASLSCAPPDRVGRASTRRTPPSASPIFRPASWCTARTKRAR